MTDHSKTVTEFLSAMFPDEKATIDAAHVEDVTHVLSLHCHDIAKQLGVPLGMSQAARPTTALPDSAVHYFIADATHTRTTEKGKHEFVGHLPHVQFTLPDSTPMKRDTFWGTVFPQDHFLPTLHDVRNYMRDLIVDPRYATEAQKLLGTVDRVDLMTQVRWLGSRFAAVGAYLLFADGKFVAYILEAGMATGAARMTYFSPNIGSMIRKAWYKPTPFSDENHTYRASVLVGFGSEDMLEEMLIECFDVPLATMQTPAAQYLKPYMTTHVKYRPAHPIAPGATGDMFIPAMLTVQAAARVALIAKTRGESIPNLPGGDVVRDLLALVGDALPWNSKPAA